MTDQIKDELEILAEYTSAMGLDIKSKVLVNIHRSAARTAIRTRVVNTKHNYDEKCLKWVSE